MIRLMTTIRVVARHNIMRSGDTSSSARWRALRAAAAAICCRGSACVAAIALTTAVHAGNALFGLTDRPANTTCVAPDRPVVVTGSRIEQAFPNLSFRTVPNDPHSQFRNGVIDAKQIPGDNSQWFVVERAGKIHRVANDDSATSFSTALDISGNFTSQYFEQWGINSIAFHPDFANNGELYVLYNDRSGSTWYAILARFTSIDGGMSFNPAT